MPDYKMPITGVTATINTSDQTTSESKTIGQAMEPVIYESCLIVGIGASAGGQAALEQFFTAMPDDCNLSFVVIMHIPLDGPSYLADMLGRYTPMEVITAEDGMALAPDKVYVIPPGNEIFLNKGHIRLEVLGEKRAPHHPIDRFFQSLAAEAGESAMVVLLSGFGADGSAGVKAVREAGGTVMIQEPGSAINPAMPGSAIATGAASFILPAEDMPAKIAEIARGSCSIDHKACWTHTLDEELTAICAIIKSKTGHDFSSYKSNTVLRRIERRMALNETGGIRKYITLLETNPREAQALGQEILIGVTSFFRDPDAFEVIKREVIPRIFAGHNLDDPVRIWHACCATGEEVYSTAILIREYLDAHGLCAKVQIFASDIDETAIAQARAGFYDDDIAEEVGEERLRTFFARCNGRWQVSKALREMVVFAHHSLIKDPPFSKLDLLVCRNFLIYINHDMQKRLISLFHMVLKPEGVLFLGASETVGRHSDQFAPIDKKWKIFKRLETNRREDNIFPFPTPVRRLPKPGPPARPAETLESSHVAVAEKLLLERYSPPCMVVNEKYEVVHVLTRVNRFIEAPVGEPTRDILKMAREELRPALRAAIYKAFNENKPVAFRGVKFSEGEEEAAVNILVEPLKAGPGTGKSGMVILEPAVPPAATPAVVDENRFSDNTSKDTLIHQMEEQLRITHEQLQATTEQLETSHEGFMSANEELMSINEEYQSTNEELQSTNEELETSKEELQALNEELITVNAELQGKVEELNQANSDMENLLASSEIAIIFLDRELTIKRYSSAMAAIFNLIPADIGRPFRHLAGTISWPDLPGDATSVLEKLAPVEREVTAMEDGRHYLMRVLPYRNLEGGIDGIVVTLIDITQRKQMEEQTLHLASFPQLNPAPVLEVDFSGKVTFYNPATQKILKNLDIAGTDVNIFIPTDLRGILENWNRKEDSILYREIKLKDYVFGETIFLASRFEAARIYAYDITERNRSEQALRESEEQFRTLADSIPNLAWWANGDGYITWYNRRWYEYTGTTPEQMEGWGWQSVHDPRVLPKVLERWKESIATGQPFEMEFPLRGADGIFRVFLTRVLPMKDSDGSLLRWFGANTDISALKQAEKEGEITVEFLRLANESRGTGDLVRAAVNFFQERSGCEAVGIRLREGDDYPYYEARGFTREFVKAENRLCDYDERGNVVLDRAGNPIIECMCGNVIRGRFDPSKPFFTAKGSFWSNCTTDLLASTSEAERQARTRNRCNGEGYESVALIPLCMGEEHLGLLQLNDRQKGRFSPEIIALWERLAGYLAVALSKFRADDEIRRHAEELRAGNEELTRFNDASVGRELRMIELKQEINELCLQTNRQPRYPLDFGEEQP